MAVQTSFVLGASQNWRSEKLYIYFIYFIPRGVNLVEAISSAIVNITNVVTKFMSINIHGLILNVMRPLLAQYTHGTGNLVLDW